MARITTAKISTPKMANTWLILHSGDSCVIVEHSNGDISLILNDQVFEIDSHEMNTYFTIEKIERCFDH